MCNRNSPKPAAKPATANRKLDATQENVTEASDKIDETNFGRRKTIAELSETNAKLSIIDRIFEKVPLLRR